MIFYYKQKRDWQNALGINAVIWGVDPEWKLSEEGGERYVKVANTIDELSFAFIEAFDKLHRLCRDKFYE